MLLRWFEGVNFVADTMTLAADDYLVVFSDDVLDAEDEEFGDE